MGEYSLSVFLLNKYQYLGNKKIFLRNIRKKKNMKLLYILKKKLTIVILDILIYRIMIKVIFDD